MGAGIGRTGAFGQNQQKRCRAEDTAAAGAMWDHTAVTVDSKLVVSLVLGKRSHEQTKAVVHDLQRRLRSGYLPVSVTDAYEGYASAIGEDFGRQYPAPSQGSSGRSRRAILRWPHGLADGQVKKQ